MEPKTLFACLAKFWSISSGGHAAAVACKNCCSHAWDGPVAIFKFAQQRPNQTFPPVVPKQTTFWLSLCYNWKLNPPVHSTGFDKIYKINMFHKQVAWFWFLKIDNWQLLPKVGKWHRLLRLHFYHIALFSCPGSSTLGESVTGSLALSKGKNSRHYWQWYDHNYNHEPFKKPKDPLKFKIVISGFFPTLANVTVLTDQIADVAKWHFVAAYFAKHRHFWTWFPSYSNFGKGVGWARWGDVRKMILHPSFLHQVSTSSSSSYLFCWVARLSGVQVKPEEETNIKIERDEKVIQHPVDGSDTFFKSWSDLSTFVLKLSSSVQLGAGPRPSRYSARGFEPVFDDRPGCSQDEAAPPIYKCHDQAKTRQLAGSEYHSLLQRNALGIRKLSPRPRDTAHEGSRGRTIEIWKHIESWKVEMVSSN